MATVNQTTESTMAARKSSKSRAQRAEALDLNPRHLWLAALGAAVAARRGAAGVAHEAGLRTRIAAADARYALRNLDANTRAGIESLSDRIQPFLCPIGRTVQAGIAPLAQRVGLSLGPQHAARRKADKPAKTSARRNPARTSGTAKRAGRKTARAVG